MSSVLTFALVGLGIGSFYVLAAQGLIVIFRGSGVLNLGLGAIGMVGAYVAFDATKGTFLSWTIPVQPFWSALLLGAAASASIGALVQQFLMRPLGQRSALVKVIATLGVLLTLQALVILQWTGVAAGLCWERRWPGQRCCWPPAPQEPRMRTPRREPRRARRPRAPRPRPCLVTL